MAEHDDRQGTEFDPVTMEEEEASKRLNDAAPALLAFARKIVAHHDRDAAQTEPGFRCGCWECVEAAALIIKAEEG